MVLELEICGASECRRVRVEPNSLVIAGWTGRNAQAQEAHIAELEELGIARPQSVPMFYRVSRDLLTTSDSIQVVGRESSGEVEAVLWKIDGAFYLGVGSDHTDRELERAGITLSKQLCAKPVSAQVWPWSDVADHWDDLTLRSELPRTGETYQDGKAINMLRPDELWALYEKREGALPDGSVMFCGTSAALGGIRFAEEMAFEVVDLVRGRTLRHSYSIEPLPIVEA